MKENSTDHNIQITVQWTCFVNRYKGIKWMIMMIHRSEIPTDYDRYQHIQGCTIIDSFYATTQILCYVTIPICMQVKPVQSALGWDSVYTKSFQRHPWCQVHLVVFLNTNKSTSVRDCDIIIIYFIFGITAGPVKLNTGCEGGFL